MANPHISTDLSSYTQAEGTPETWVEPANPTGWTALQGGGSRTEGGDTDDFIQGTACASDQPKTGVNCLLSNETGIQIPTNGAVLIWIKYDASVGLDDNTGIRVALGTGTSNLYGWDHFGKENYILGGWKCLAQASHTDLNGESISPDYTLNSAPSSGDTYTYIGYAASCSSAPSKGSGYKVDAIRIGRCDLTVVNGDNTSVDNTASGKLGSSAANFAQLAEYNDYNNGTTLYNSNTSITPTGLNIDSGYHRLGLFQSIAGGYLWKGRLQLGTSANAVYFHATNENINVDDTRLVTNTFNKIEIANTSSTVIWDTINFSSLAVRSKGQLEVLDSGATFTISSCAFAGMDTFTFLDGTSIDASTFRGCNTVFQQEENTCTITDTNFVRSTGTTALYSANNTNVTSCEFISAGTGHAIEANTTGTYNFSGHTFTGYATANGATGNEVFHNNSNGLITLNISGITGTISVRNSGTSTTTITATNNFTVKNIISGSELRLIAVSDNNELTNSGVEIVSGSPSGVGANMTVASDPDNPGRFQATYTHSISVDTAIYVVVHITSGYQYLRSNFTLKAETQSLQVSQIPDRVYTNP